MLTRTRPQRHTDACEGEAHCAYWHGPDRDCGQLTAAHSAYCSEHADQDDMPWTEGHDPEDCCPGCCGEDGCHA